MTNLRIQSFLSLATFAFSVTAMVYACEMAHARTFSAGPEAVTKVGNGDDGKDLEGFEKIQSGPIVDSRQKAVALLEKLNVAGVRGLGQLAPEVEKTQLYVAKKDVEALENESNGKFHSNLQGLVFARTFAEPHAETRFFPIAKQLDENQLVSLHIHEGLHRALPESIREDEDIVSQLTVAITSPNSTYDRIATVSSKVIPEERHKSTAQIYDDGKIMSSMEIPEDAEIKRPSILRYGYRSYQNSSRNEVNTQIKRMHLIESHMFPFGDDRNPIGIGISASLIGLDTGNELGPLGLSGRYRLWSGRGFDVGMWAEMSLNTLSNEELKNSPYGRDVTTLGLSARKDTKWLYVENSLGVTLPSQRSVKLGDFEFEHKYGSITMAKIRVGGKYKGISLGGFAEILLADNYKVSQKDGEFSTETGRFYITSAGPEASYSTGEFTFTLLGRFITSRTKDVNYDAIGNVLGVGAGEGYLGASIAINL